MSAARRLPLLFAITLAVGEPALAADNKPPPNLSARAKAFLAKKWDANSFNDGLAVALDRTETLESRSVSIETLNANRRKLSAADLRRLHERAASIAKDESEAVPLSAHAIRVMGNAGRL